MFSNSVYILYFRDGSGTPFHLWDIVFSGRIPNISIVIIKQMAKADMQQNVLYFNIYFIILTIVLAILSSESSLLLRNRNITECEIYYLSFNTGKIKLNFSITNKAMFHPSCENQITKECEVLEIVNNSRRAEYSKIISLHKAF